MYSVVSTAVIRGIESIPILVEADVSEGMPVFDMVGFLGAEVREAKERVRTALRNCGYPLPAKRITINLSPVNIRKNGAGFDLPIAVAILAALGVIDKATLEHTVIIGEIGLNGKIQPIHGVLPIVAKAKESGETYCVLPGENYKEASLITGITIIAVETLLEVIAFFRKEIMPEKADNECGEKTDASGTAQWKDREEKLDFSQVNGQILVRRACEVAAAGMHNLLMIGPPGSGKTMIAKRMPGILPCMDEEEQMEVSKIYSVCGMFEQREKLMAERPFRAPHHTITPQGLAGGGHIPKPGEISLAHRGVLFLDELPEFQKGTLEILRQPLEEKYVQLVRLGGSFCYPADFLLIAAMNPCNCGYFPNLQKCSCASSSIERYLARISQPLLDRIDIAVEAPQMTYGELTKTGQNESSADIRIRVMRAQNKQKERFRAAHYRFNSQIPSSDISKFCKLGKKQEKYMEKMYQKLELSARAYHKILKVSRTIADLEECEEIEVRHLTEAVCYRSLDKKFWER